MQEIYKGSAPNDKTGTPARQASDIINNNFAYLEAKISNVDQIITQTGYSLDSQDLTMNAGWIWNILGTQYTNPVDVVTSISFASTGLQRLDMFVLNQSNTYTYIIGEESEIAVKPLKPVNTIEAFLVLVGDDLVGEPSIPVLGEDYKLKSESTDIIINYPDAVIEQINLFDNKNSLSLTGTVTDIKSVQIAAEFIYPGKPHFVKNRSGHDVTIWHNSGTGNIKYSFPNSQNYIIKPNEVLEFNTNANDSSVLKFEFVGKILTASEIKTAYESNSNTNAFTDALLYKLNEVDQNVSTAEKATWNGKQNALGFTPEDTANKKTEIVGNESSTSFFGVIKAWLDYFKDGLGSLIPTKLTALVDADRLIIFDSEDSGKTKTRTFAQLKATFLAYFENIFSKNDRLLENSTVTGTYNLDYSAYELWNLTLTANTTLTESNLMPKTILLRITGNYALTFPSGWGSGISGVYAGTVSNTIVVQYFKTGLYKVSIIQPD